MRTTFIALSAIIGLAFAQAGLPSCAQSCIPANFGGCGSLNVTCICADNSLLTNLACCVSTACDAADQETTIKFADSLCAGAGVTSIPTAATCASSSTASSTFSMSSKSSSALAVTTSSVMTTSSPMATSSTAAAAASTTESSASSAAVSTTSAAAASTGGAATNLVAGLGFGAVFAGALALL